MEQMNDQRCLIFTPHIMHPACRGGTAAGIGRKNLKSKSLAGSVCVCVASCIGTSFTAICCYLALREKKVDSKCFATLRDIQGACFVPGSSPMCHANMTIKRKHNGGSCAACPWLLQSFALWTNQSCCSQAATCSLMLWSFSRISEVRLHDWMDDTLSNPISHSISYCRAYQFELNIRNVWTPASEPQHAMPVCIMGNRDRRSNSKFQHQDP